MYQLFLAWQSQNKITANFIKKHLEKAIKALKQEGIEIKIIKTPTQDESGSPDINLAIWEQIQSSDIFFADMSFVSKDVYMSNGNVMYETGIADALLGSSRVIIVCDQDTNVENISFDINHKRISKIKTDNNEQYKEFTLWIKAAIEEADKDKYIKNFSNQTYADELLFLVNYFFGLFKCRNSRQELDLRCSKSEIINVLRENIFPEFYLRLDFSSFIQQMEDKLLKLYPFSHKKITWYMIRIITLLKEYNNFLGITKMNVFINSNNEQKTFYVYSEKNFCLKDAGSFSNDMKHILLNGKNLIFRSDEGVFLILDNMVKDSSSLVRFSAESSDTIETNMIKISTEAVNILSNLIKNILDAIYGYFTLANVRVELDKSVDLIVLQLQ